MEESAFESGNAIEMELDLIVLSNAMEAVGINGANGGGPECLR
jgi:hypothetical protein